MYIVFDEVTYNAETKEGKRLLKNAISTFVNNNYEVDEEIYTQMQDAFVLIDAQHPEIENHKVGMETFWLAHKELKRR